MSNLFLSSEFTSKTAYNASAVLKQRLVATIILAGTASLVASLPPAFGEEPTDSKGLIRTAVTQPSHTEPIKGRVSTDLFGNPNAEEASDTSPSEPQSAADRLNAVITKTQSSPWDRFFKQGNDSYFQGRYEDAEKHYFEALHELKKTNKKDERLLKTRNALGQAFLDDGKYLDAKQTFELCMKSAEDLGKEKSTQMAKAMSGLASVYKANKQYKKAEEYYKDSIRVRQEAEGSDSSQIALTLLNLGELYREQKLFSEAEPVYGLALETLNNAKNVPALAKAHFLDKAGMCFYDQGKITDARRLFEISLLIKDKFSRLYSPTDARKTGLVHYKCLNGIPNAAKVFTRGIEIEALHVKDLTAVATLKAQRFGTMWDVLEAEVTVHNQGKTAVSALADTPTLMLEVTKRKLLTPLDSDAIANELGLRGRLLADRLFHSADFAYVANQTVGPVSTVALTPGGPAIFNTVGSWTTITPDWDARLRARNAAFSALASANAEGASVRSLKPAQTTIGPGETATFLVFFPYNTYEACTLRMLFGNAVLEFPFGNGNG